jgi:hypothetical protein
VEEPTITKSNKGVAGLVLNKEHAHCFFLSEGDCSLEFVPPNTTVNSYVYCDVLRRSRENVRQKRPEILRNHNWLIHHDYTPTHMSWKTRVCD